MTKTVTCELLLVVLAFAPRVQALPRFAPTPLPTLADRPPVEVLFSSTPARLFGGWPLVVTVRAELHEQEGNVKAAMVACCNASWAESVLLHATGRDNAKKGNIAGIALPRYDAPCERLKRQLKEAAQSAGQPPQDLIRKPESGPRVR
ncbi:hypothetical protein WA016_04759 [Myxococcus stipitatus]